VALHLVEVRLEVLFRLAASEISWRSQTVPKPIDPVKTSIPSAQTSNWLIKALVAACS